MFPLLKFKDILLCTYLTLKITKSCCCRLLWFCAGAPDAVTMPLVGAGPYVT